MCNTSFTTGLVLGATTSQSTPRLTSAHASPTSSRTRTHTQDVVVRGFLCYVIPLHCQGRAHRSWRRARSTVYAIVVSCVGPAHPHAKTHVRSRARLIMSCNTFLTTHQRVSACRTPPPHTSAKTHIRNRSHRTTLHVTLIPFRSCFEPRQEDACAI